MWRRLLNLIMRYLRLIRKSEQKFVTIGDYIEINQPEIYEKLLHWKKTSREAKAKDITEQVLQASKAEGYWAKIQSERPKPGRGGILPWEKEVEF
jgi:hypothetical protein